MKQWFVLLLVMFILVAGYKFSGYQHQLSESKAEKERLSSVLARPRSTENSELKVIKPTGTTSHTAPILQTTSASKTFTRTNSSEDESSLKAFLAAYFVDVKNETSDFTVNFKMESVSCVQDTCRVGGQYNGSERELTTLVASLEANAWWGEEMPTINVQRTHNDVKLNLVFSTYQSIENNGAIIAE